MKCENTSDKDAPRCHGNIPAENDKFIRQAAEKTGFNVTVSSDARDNRQRILPGLVSVWTNEPLARDHGPFWREYRRLVDAAKTE